MISINIFLALALFTGAIRAHPVTTPSSDDSNTPTSTDKPETPTSTVEPGTDSSTDPDMHLFTIPNYQTGYSVADLLTGDQKSSNEIRVGDEVRGYYCIVQPDGVVRTVVYTSSPVSGFQAKVFYSGSSRHPATKLPTVVLAPLLGVVSEEGANENESTQNDNAAPQDASSEPEDDSMKSQEASSPAPPASNNHRMKSAAPKESDNSMEKPSQQYHRMKSAAQESDNSMEKQYHRMKSSAQESDNSMEKQYHRMKSAAPPASMDMATEAPVMSSEEEDSVATPDVVPSPIAARLNSSPLWGRRIKKGRKGCCGRKDRQNQNESSSY